MMPKQKLLILILFSIQLYHGIFGAELKGDNVCEKPKITPVEYEVKKIQCHEHLFIFETDDCLKNLDILANKTIKECCNGYLRSGSECISECKQNCLHGDCIQDKNGTSFCYCELNFGGIKCDQECGSKKFGLNCEKDCEHIQDPNRNKQYAHCSCSDLAATQTDLCRDICNCRMHRCPVGFIGKNCTVPCESNKYGPLCMNDCKCAKESTLNCNKESGDCECKPYYYGKYCEKKCSNGILVCESQHNSINCVCQMSLEQRMKLMEKNRDNMMIVLSLLAFFFFLLLALVYKYKIKSKKLKDRLDMFSIRYVNDDKDGYDNQIYSKNLNKKDLDQSSTLFKSKSNKSRLGDWLNRISRLLENPLKSNSKQDACDTSEETDSESKRFSQIKMPESV